MRITGVRPTGQMHIGHYFSVIKPAKEIPYLTVLIAEHHAPQGHLTDRTAVDKMVKTLVRFGVPKENIRYQSEEFDATTYFQLLSIAKVGELERMTQYMAAAEVLGQGQGRDAHLLVYPILMVHDVFGYDEVYVGDDQTQHVNYARDLIERYNRVFPGSDIVLPKAVPVGGRVMSLTDPTKKMSKSDPEGCLFLDDSLHKIEQKIKKATMTPEGKENLVQLYRALGGTEAIPEMNSDFKPMVAEQIIKLLHPVHAIQPVKDKIGEPAGNLDARGAWFQGQTS